jgi:hypothetical protein
MYACTLYELWFEALTTVKMSVLVFWVTSPHGVTVQKNNTDIRTTCYSSAAAGSFQSPEVLIVKGLCDSVSDFVLKAVNKTMPVDTCSHYIGDQFYFISFRSEACSSRLAEKFHWNKALKLFGNFQYEMPLFDFTATNLNKLKAKWRHSISTYVLTSSFSNYEDVKNRLKSRSKLLAIIMFRILCLFVWRLNYWVWNLVCYIKGRTQTDWLCLRTGCWGEYLLRPEVTMISVIICTHQTLLTWSDWCSGNFMGSSAPGHLVRIPVMEKCCVFFAEGTEF